MALLDYSDWNTQRKIFLFLGRLEKCYLEKIEQNKLNKGKQNKTSSCLLDLPKSTMTLLRKNIKNMIQ